MVATFAMMRSKSRVSAVAVETSSRKSSSSARSWNRTVDLRARVAISYSPPAVAHALLRAASALMPTLGLSFCFSANRTDLLKYPRQTGVGMSADAARKSACATMDLRRMLIACTYPVCASGRRFHDFYAGAGSDAGGSGGGHFLQIVKRANATRGFHAHLRAHSQAHQLHIVRSCARRAKTGGCFQDRKSTRLN